MALVFISFSCNIDCNRLSATYSYVACGIRMTHLVHILHAYGWLQKFAWWCNPCGPLKPFSPHLDTSCHVNIQWCRGVCCGVASATQHKQRWMRHLICFVKFMCLLCVLVVSVASAASVFAIAVVAFLIFSIVRSRRPSGNRWSKTASSSPSPHGGGQPMRMATPTCRPPWCPCRPPTIAPSLRGVLTRVF